MVLKKPQPTWCRLARQRHRQGVPANFANAASVIIAPANAMETVMPMQRRHRQTDEKAAEAVAGD